MIIKLILGLFSGFLLIKKMASLQDLFVSKVRVKLLKIFLSNPGKIFYVRQLVRLAGEEINAVRRELARMEERGLVKKERRANRLYYEFQKDLYINSFKHGRCIFWLC